MDNNFNNYNQNGFNQAPQYNQNNFNHAPQNDGAMGWDEEVTAESKEYTVLPDGIYPFIIKDAIVKGKTSGKGKLPVCNMATVTITIEFEGKEIKVKDNITLHRSIEWKISQFFESLGMKQKGVPFRPDWNGIVGKTGLAKMHAEEGSDGNMYNKVKEYIISNNNQPLQEFVNTAAQPQQNFSQSAPQNNQNQQNNWNSGWN